MASLTVKIDSNGFLAGYLPKKIWYALFNQKIIMKENGKWKVDMTKRDEIQLPIEIVDQPATQTSSRSQTRKNKTQILKNLFLEALEHANQEARAFIETIDERVPTYAVGEPKDMLASLQGKPSPLKNVQGFVKGTCGFVNFNWVALNTTIGRFLSKWEKEGNAPFRLSRSSHYGNALYLTFESITGVNKQMMELKAHAYYSFRKKFNELLEAHGFETVDWHVKQHVD